MDPRIWRTRDGREIPYENLADDHLLAILGMWTRRAAALAGLRGARLLLEQWPEEAHDEQDELWQRGWRSVKAPEWFADLEAIAKTRRLDMKSIEDEAADIQELVETRMLIDARVPCGDCHGDMKVLTGVPTDQPVEKGLAGLLESTLAKKEPLNERDFDLVRMVLARATAGMSPLTEADGLRGRKS